MKFPAIAIILMLIFPSNALSSTRPELSEEALIKTCSLANALLVSSTAIGEKFFELAHLFPAEKRKNLKDLIETQLKSRTYVAFDVYQIGDLNGLLVEHFIAAQSSGKGTLYIRMRFEPFDNEPQLYHFKYQDDLDAALVQTFLQKPVLTSCP